MKTFTEILWAGKAFYADISREPMFDGSPRVSTFPLSAKNSTAAGLEARTKGLGTPRWVDSPNDYDRIAGLHERQQS